MFPPTGVSAAVARIPVDIRRFPWIRPLAADYAFDYPKLGAFFAGNPADPADWRQAINRAQQRQGNRDAVTAIVEAQQQRRNAPAAARTAAAQLRHPQTVAVVTGQQAVVFGGPLFTLLKALTAIKLAAEVSRTYQVTAVPVFWIDAEDHDWDEVSVCGVLDPDLALKPISVGTPAGAHAGPVAGVRLDAAGAAAIQELAATLEHTAFTSQLLERLGQTYREGAGMAVAFGEWLEAVLGEYGLVVFDASDAAAKPLVADLFVREIEHAGETAHLVAEAGRALEALGYHAQATPQPGAVALFHLNGTRESIRQDGDAFIVGEGTESKAHLLSRVQQSPASFSPNVLLRPLVQDTLFPTACYVAGPNELAYLAQLRDVYSAFDLPMPLLYQRATATLVDSNAMRFLLKHELPLETLQVQDDSALNELLATQLPAGVEASLQEAVHAVDERLSAIARAVVQVDATLEGAVRSTQSRLQDDLKKLHGKVIQAAKRKDETLRRQFTHARALAFPGGHPQERSVGFVYFLNKYGPPLVERLNEELPLDMGTHWVLTI